MVDTQKYVVIIPAKNEQANIANTLQSVLNQSVQPEVCVVVDDGSTDSTTDIVDSFAKDNSKIKVVSKQGNLQYVLGGHVVEVFEYGRAWVNAQGIDYDYIVKLDADLEFEMDHVAKIFAKINDGKWGVVSGTPYTIEHDKRVYDYSPDWHSQGQFKFYNRKFLDQLPLLPRSLGWDCADNIIAIEQGWESAAFKDVHYKMFRKVGGKHSLTLGRSKHGVGCYVLGYSPWYVCIRAIHDLFKPPLILGSLSLMYGYLRAVIERRDRILNKRQSSILRQILWGSLFSRLKNREFHVMQRFQK